MQNPKSQQTKIQNPKSKIQNRLIPDLRPDEKLVLFQRQHPAILFRNLAWPVCLFFIWLVSLVFVMSFISSLAPSSSPDVAARWFALTLWVVWMGLAVMLCLWIIYLVLDWGDDWVALTTHRLIVMKKSLIFHEMRSEVPVDKVYGVTFLHPNSLATTFNFGNLYVDTAALGVILFENIPHPKVMAEAIFAQQAALDNIPPTAADRRKAAVDSILRSAVAANTTPNPQPPTPNSDTIIWHKHWIYLLRGVARLCLLLGVAFLLWVVSLFMLQGARPEDAKLSEVFGWLLLALIPFCLFRAFYKWEDWRNDLYKVDGQRIYDTESLPLGLREEAKEALITRVTDVSYTMPSPLAHLLDYGDVVLKTPGESTEFTFRCIPHPREVQREIMRRVEQFRLEDKVSTEKEIEEWLKVYHDAQSGSV